MQFICAGVWERLRYGRVIGGYDVSFLDPSGDNHINVKWIIGIRAFGKFYGWYGRPRPYNPPVDWARYNTRDEKGE